MKSAPQAPKNFWGFRPEGPKIFKILHFIEGFSAFPKLKSEKVEKKVLEIGKKSAKIGP